eukprot:TRINITY_DN8834_c0_g2_i1.p1 TRINITY_DN8834_c0_g2~~TRINITY_DN8834_c0_g2_i1.p1  ORF type:complete len:278 (+),score=73.58 TRINITY_DN8834_c0_g2_i1:87-836(+)
MGRRRKRAQSPAAPAAAAAAAAPGSPGGSPQAKRARQEQGGGKKQPSPGILDSPARKQTRRALRRRGLRWADTLPGKPAPLTVLHAYDAPWSKDKRNWWQQTEKEECQAPFSVTMQPGEVRHMHFPANLNLYCVLRSAFAFPAAPGADAPACRLISLFQPTEAYALIREVRRIKSRSPPYTFKHFKTQAVVEEGAQKRRVSRQLLGAFLPGRSYRLYIPMSGEHVILQNDGPVQLRLSGVAHGVYFEML